MEWVDKAIELDADNKEAYALRAKIYLALGEHEKAAEDEKRSK